MTFVTEIVSTDSTPFLYEFMRRSIEAAYDEWIALQGPIPTINLCTFLAELRTESGIFCVDDVWYYVVGSIGSIELGGVPPAAACVGHTHTDGLDSDTIPSPWDFIHSPDGIDRAFVISHLGITQYTPLRLDRTAAEHRRFHELYRLGRKIIDTEEESDALVRRQYELGCRWTFQSYEAIGSNENLVRLLLGR